LCESRLVLPGGRRHRLPGTRGCRPAYLDAAPGGVPDQLTRHYGLAHLHRGTDVLSVVDVTPAAVAQLQPDEPPARPARVVDAGDLAVAERVHRTRAAVVNAHVHAPRGQPRADRVLVPIAGPRRRGAGRVAGLRGCGGGGVRCGSGGPGAGDRERLADADHVGVRDLRLVRVVDA